MRDVHQGLKTEELSKANEAGVGVEFSLIRHQWGKEDFEYSLHAFPNQWTTAGLQTTDLLGLLKFQRNACAFRSGSECFAQHVSGPFDTKEFSKAFAETYSLLEGAERNLQNCGILLPQQEGWGYFFGKRSRGDRGRRNSPLADGHTGAKVEQLKKAADDAFQFVLTWLVTANGQKGWITHYQFRNAPPSVELLSVFEFLGLRTFKSCPEYDFEQCFWSTYHFTSDDDDPFNRSADSAHGYFDALHKNFSPGVEQLLKAHRAIEPFGLQLLPIPTYSQRQATEFARRAPRPNRKMVKAQVSDGFDVAISFAGTEREYAHELAKRLQDAGYVVFYDDFYPEDLWGKNLVEFFHEVYSKRSRYCVMFVSAEYANRAWTIHERRSAQERMLKEKGGEYILPIKVDATELPGLPATTGYLPIEKGLDEIASILIKKLQQ